MEHYSLVSFVSHLKMKIHSTFMVHKNRIGFTKLEDAKLCSEINVNRVKLLNVGASEEMHIFLMLISLPLSCY